MRTFYGIAGLFGSYQLHDDVDTTIRLQPCETQRIEVTNILTAEELELQARVKRDHAWRTVAPQADSQ